MFHGATTRTDRYLNARDLKIASASFSLATREGWQVDTAGVTGRSVIFYPVTKLRIARRRCAGVACDTGAFLR